MDSRHTPSYSVESLKILSSYFFLKRKSKKEIKRRGDGREERRAEEQGQEGEGREAGSGGIKKQSNNLSTTTPFSLAWLE